MTTGRTLKTGDVIRSLNLVEIRRQQRRVTTLLNGDPKDIPLISYRQADAPSYRGENLGARRWGPGVGLHQKTYQMNPNEQEPFWNNSDDPPTKREQLKRTKDNRSLHPLNNSPTDDEPTTLSSTTLPPIDSHKTSCARRQSPGGARKKPEIRRQMSPATEQSIATRNGHVTRSRKSSNKSRNKSSKPVVKYQHQKLEPAAEERYRKYRQVAIDGLRKVTSCSTPEVWLRSDSGLSSLSEVSARRRRHVQFQGEDEENGGERNSMLKSSSAGWGASDSDQLGQDGLREAVDGRTASHLRSMEKDNTNEDNFSNGLTLEDSGRCHPTPVADGSPWKGEPSVRLPDIQIYNSNRPLLLSETRRFNPDIGETSRAFVFSYFDHLPALNSV